MANWRLTVNLADIWEVDMPFKHKRDVITKRIHSSGWMNDSLHPDELLELVSDLAVAQSHGEFNAIWNFIYDIADADGVWIATF